MQNKLFPLLLLALLGIGMVTGYEFMDGTLPAETSAYAAFDLTDVKAAQEANTINASADVIALRDKNLESAATELPSENYRVGVSLFATTKAPRAR